jgi:predicted transcriptional regulator
MTEQSIQQFITAYNRVHKALCRELKHEGHLEFSKAVRRYGDLHRSFRYIADLQLIGDLRNVMVHEQLRPNEYLAYPSHTTMATLQKVLDELENPEYLIPRFQRKVEVVSPEDPLSEVLPRVLKGNYSQFPVYDGDTFKGLLTENGIVRYLAHHRTSIDSMIELADVSVSSLLKQDENRRNCAFAPRTERLDAMLDRFAQSPILEAVLITASGKKDEKPLGIATQWDALEAIKERTP